MVYSAWMQNKKELLMVFFHLHLWTYGHLWTYESMDLLKVSLMPCFSCSHFYWYAFVPVCKSKQLYPKSCQLHCKAEIFLMKMSLRRSISNCKQIVEEMIKKNSPFALLLWCTDDSPAQFKQNVHIDLQLWKHEMCNKNTRRYTLKFVIDKLTKGL